MDDFFGFAREEDPRYPVGEDTLGTSREPTGDALAITVTGTFGSGLEQARAELVERLAASDLPGAEADPERAVQRVGQTLYVAGLAPLDEGEEDEEEDHPLVGIFQALGAERVLVEGDRFGEGAIVVDVCAQAPSADAAGEIADTLLDYWALFYYMWARPPWHPTALAADERKARRTFRALVGGKSVGADGHAELAALYRKQPRSVDPAKIERWGQEMGRFTGPLAGGQQGAALSAATGYVRSQDDRVDVAWINFPRFAAGFPAFLAWLWQAGCREIRYDLVDFDEVRGD